jgi:hypothetical protein
MTKSPVHRDSVRAWLEAHGGRVSLDSRTGLYRITGPLECPAFGEKPPGLYYAEVKRRFSYFRVAGLQQTGIDTERWPRLASADAADCSCWLLLLHHDPHMSDQDIAHGSPKESPTGLFGQAVAVLDGKKRHRGEMLYWSLDDLIRLASLEELSSC